MNPNISMLKSILEAVDTHRKSPLEDAGRTPAFLAHSQLLYKAGMIDGIEFDGHGRWTLDNPELTSSGRTLYELMGNDEKWQSLEAVAELWTMAVGPATLKEWLGRTACDVERRGHPQGVA